ncbi:hypothetical protein TSOC_012072 [Tetrabaena socialis]|uniref:Ankyrin repeat domain-containing protein n=1 Tax=Tetrabaena socialis TaxID=47790 RepID=A0A2J7ZNZ3_9CHLO|nr:hypothetical protein TSOC_012072 [Tetrabaena socialis]|eukprot:PNH01994.1 hypothetical protein TSOC_012072 [Tetrabaena socialis]
MCRYNSDQKSGTMQFDEFMAAIKAGNIDIVRQILSNDVVVVYWLTVGLVAAIESGNIDIVEIIIKHDGVVPYGLRQGVEAAVKASQNGESAIVDLIRSHPMFPVKYAV